MAVLSDRCAATENGAHVDHAPFADDGADVDNSAHHDDSILADCNLLTDCGSRLNAGRDILEVEHGDGRVAAVVFDDNVSDFLSIGFQDWTELAPVSKNDFVAHAEYRCRTVINRCGFLDIELHRRLLFGLCNMLNDLLCVHCAFSSWIRFCIV